jgi:hypothetical protein
MTERVLTHEEFAALMVRHEEAIRLVGRRELDPCEALLLVVAPSPVLLEASLAAVRVDGREAA